MERKQILAVTVALVGLCIIGEVDYSEALTQEAIEKEARPQRAMLGFPIDYDAIVCQRSYYAEQAKCRYYAKRDK